MPHASSSLLWRKIIQIEKVPSSEPHAIQMGTVIYIPETIRKSFHEPKRNVNAMNNLELKTWTVESTSQDFNSGYKLLFTDLSFLVNYMERVRRAGIGKLQPMGQILPNTCFCMTCELGMVFTFFYKRLNQFFKEHFLILEII